MEKHKIFKNINFWRVFQLTSTFSLLLIYLIQWGKMISIPSQRTGTDFIAFYAAGQISHEYGFSSVYNINAQHEIEQTVVGFDLTEKQILPYIHPPYSIPVLKLLVNTNYIGSFARWTVLMLGIYIFGGIFFLNTIFANKKNSIYSTLMMGMLTFFPFFYSLLLGQDTALLFIGVSLWCVGILKKQDWLAATGLALTTIRPHICLILAIPLFFRYRKVWWRFFIIASFLTVASILMLGWEGTLDFINLMRLSANGAGYGTNELSMLNLIGLTWRVFPTMESRVVHAIGWFSYLIGIGLVSVLWIKARELDGRLLSISIIIALLGAPHLHYHDLALLIIPLIFIVTLPSSVIVQKYLALMPLSISLLMILEPIRYILPYVLYFSLIWWMVKKHPEANIKLEIGIHR